MRGGARPGAGRPRGEGYQTVAIALPRSEAAVLRERAAEAGKTVSRYIADELKLKKEKSMFDLSEMEVYYNDWETLISEEDYLFYKEELEAIRAKETGVILAWVEPDEDVGHIEYKVFRTWSDLEIARNQK